MPAPSRKRALRAAVLGGVIGLGVLLAWLLGAFGAGANPLTPRISTSEAARLTQGALPPAPPQAPGTVPAENLADISPAAGNVNGSTVIVRCSFDGGEILIGCRSQQVPQP